MNSLCGSKLAGPVVCHGLKMCAVVIQKLPLSKSIERMVLQL